MALAIADRLLLEGVVPQRRIFATGTLVPGSRGEIGGIDGLEAKLGHVKAAADPGDVFGFPFANLRTLSVAAEVRIAALRARGVVVHAAAAMPELGSTA